MWLNDRTYAWILMMLGVFVYWLWSKQYTRAFPVPLGGIAYLDRIIPAIWGGIADAKLYLYSPSSFTLVVVRKHMQKSLPREPVELIVSLFRVVEGTSHISKETFRRQDRCYLRISVWRLPSEKTAAQLEEVRCGGSVQKAVATATCMHAKARNRLAQSRHGPIYVWGRGRWRRYGVVFGEFTDLGDHNPFASTE